MSQIIKKIWVEQEIVDCETMQLYLKAKMRGLEEIKVEF